MRWDFEQLLKQVKEEAASVQDLAALENFRQKYLSRKGLVAEIYASLGQAAPEDKPAIGKGANDLKASVTVLVDEQQKNLQSSGAKVSNKSSLDVTLPGVSVELGRPHILTQTILEICQIFEKMGFVRQDGPEVENEFNNFTALNIPVDHPSRDSFDTFYVTTPDPDPKRAGRNLLLRSHTSPGQIHIMQNNKPPLAVIVPGRVYRPDAVDASHSFMFHQIEGLLVDADVKMSDLKGLLLNFCQKFFSEKSKVRFRPHFFPFTEPSAEVDVSCSQCGGDGCSTCGHKGWLEIMGCGLVHPKVFEAVGYPKAKYSGLAFGMGVERMAMLRHGINDIRLFYENDVRFLKQF